jgi:hypothetical protein
MGGQIQRERPAGASLPLFWLTWHAFWLAPGSLCLIVATGYQDCAPVPPEAAGDHGPFAIGEHSWVADLLVTSLLVGLAAAPVLAVVSARVRKASPLVPDSTELNMLLGLAGGFWTMVILVFQYDQASLCKLGSIAFITGPFVALAVGAVFLNWRDAQRR